MFNVYALTDWQFYLNAIYFLIIVFLFFLNPALFFLKKITTLKNWQKLTLSFILGTSLWTIQAFVFGYLHCRWLTYVYVGVMLIIDAIFIFKNNQQWRQFWVGLGREIKATPKYLLLLLAIGAISQTMVIGGSGLINREQHSVPFYYSNGSDALMHLSFIGGMTEEFPPVRPEIYAEPLINYHYFSDLFLADLARVFHLPIDHLFFHYTPLLISLFTALTFASLIRFFTPKRSALVIGWLVLFFGSDLAYLVSLYLHHGFRWQAATIDHGLEQFLNYPQTWAKLNFFGSLFLLLIFWRQNDPSVSTKLKTKPLITNKVLLPLIVIIGSITIGYKVYYGLFLLLGLFLVTATALGKSIVQFIFSKKNKPTTTQKFLPTIWQGWQPFFWVGILTALPALVIFLSNNSQTSGIFWEPLAWPRLLLSPSHLDDINFFLTDQYYLEIGATKGIIKNTAWALCTGLLGIIGARLIGLWPPSRRKYPALNWTWYVWFYPTVIIFIFLGLNTLQYQGGFNTFNFLIVAINALLLPLTLNLANWWSSHWAGKIAVSLILALSLPKTIQILTDFPREVIEYRPTFALDLAEYELLNQAVSTLPAGALIQPHPANLSSNQQTAYLDFFSHHPTYLTSTNTLGTHHHDYQDRQEQLATYFSALNQPDKARETLRQINQQLGIEYLYLQNEPAQTEIIPFVKPAQIVLHNEAGYFVKTD